MLFTKFILPLFFLFQTFSYVAQTIKGKVTDENTKQSVPFAFIGINNSNKGTTADIDGNFTLTIDTGVTEIVVQIIGYNKTIIDVKNRDLSKPIIAKLKPSEFNLLEVVITPKENPANELIRKLIKNKKNLDPRNLPFYSCETYGKTYFTASTTSGDENYYNEDSTRFKKGKATLDKQYLFFIESATEKKYIYKNITQEKILASRVSGFKSAPFATLASQLQSFTFFDNTISVMDIKYVNPLQKGTFKRYKFEIVDTLVQNADTIILITFSPRKNSNFKALKGTLYLNKADFALANVIAEPIAEEEKSNSVKIQQQYRKIDGKHWFPTQLSTEILFQNAKFSSDKSQDPRIMKCLSKLYISDINLDSSIKIKKKNIEVINEKGYESKTEEFWNAKRVDSLTTKEKNSYRIIDSIGKKAQFENKLKIVKILSTGQIPIGPISIDIRRIIKANDYEGVRLGAGLVTNDKLTKWASVGCFAGYGFKDKAWKYGGHLQVNFNEAKSINMKAELARDLQETAHTGYIDDNSSLLSTENIRNYLVGMMDKISFAKLSFNTPINRFIKSSFYYSTTQRVSLSGYANPEPYLNSNITTFNSNEAGIQLKIWPFEKFTESFLGILSLGSKWPSLCINYSQTIPVTIDDYSNTFTYQKLSLKLNHRILFNIRGYLNYQIRVGKVFGDVPYSFQSNNNGSRINKYYISAENSFETMYLNEFISTEYAWLFTTYNTGKVFKKNKYFNPEFEFVHNAGYGQLLNREQLTNIELNDISKIYTEAGLRIKNIIQSSTSSIGLCVFYRYGYYAFSEPKSNVALKLVLGYNFN